MHLDRGNNEKWIWKNYTQEYKIVKGFIVLIYGRYLVYDHTVFRKPIQDGCTVITPMAPTWDETVAPNNVFLKAFR